MSGVREVVVRVVGGEGVKRPEEIGRSNFNVVAGPHIQEIGRSNFNVVAGLTST